MAERLKDSQDRMLEAMFRFDPVPDDGFSATIVSRVRRRVWLQQLALPAAFVIGTLIAIKPVLQLASLLSGLVAHLPANLMNTIMSPLENMFHGTTIMLGMMLLGALLMIGRLLEE